MVLILSNANGNIISKRCEIIFPVFFFFFPLDTLSRSDVSGVRHHLSRYGPVIKNLEERNE